MRKKKIKKVVKKIRTNKELNKELKRHDRSGEIAKALTKAIKKAEKNGHSVIIKTVILSDGETLDHYQCQKHTCNKHIAAVWYMESYIRFFRDFKANGCTSNRDDGL